MKRASILVRALPAFRYESFASGLAACGYDIVETGSGGFFRGKAVKDPSRDDVLLIWNHSHLTASFVSNYQRAGARIIVAENGYLGREWHGSVWYALALDHHNGAGSWPEESGERWDSWDVLVHPWRASGEDIVILAQRGIGHPSVRQPRNWARDTQRAMQARTGRRVRIRDHPGEKNDCTPLPDDLRGAWAVATWGSGAALKALLLGIPVFHAFPQWIGAPAALPLAADLEKPFLGARLPMFRRLAHSMWRLDEIESGVAFRALLESSEARDGGEDQGYRMFAAG